MKTLLLTVLLIYTNANAQIMAEMSYRSAQCARVQTLINATIGIELVQKCGNPNSPTCSACCHAAVSAYLQAQRAQQNANAAQATGNTTSVGNAGGTGVVQQLVDLEQSLRAANFPLNSQYGQYTANTNAQVDQVVANVTASYNSSLQSACNRTQVAQIMNNRGVPPPNTVANNDQATSIELTPQRVRQIRNGVNIDWNILNRRLVDDPIGVSRGNIFRMISNQYQSQVRRGGLR